MIGGNWILIADRLRTGAFSSFNIEKGIREYLEAIWGFSLLGIGFSLLTVGILF